MNYILYTDNSFLFFSHSPVEGLMLKRKSKRHWEENVSVYRDAKDGFFVYMDENKTIHILCTDSKNNIIYLTDKSSEWCDYVLSSVNPEIVPIEFKIAKAGNILNFFYTAKYKGSIILVHCVMGANAKPEILDTLCEDSADFNIGGTRIYYTNKNKALGYRDFSDSKPGNFIFIEQDAINPYFLKTNDGEYLLYKKGDSLYFNQNCIFKDLSSQKPILQIHDNKLIMQWKSGNFVRYITSFNNGITWSSPMRFIGSGDKVCEFLVDTGEGAEFFYGQNLLPDPVLYGKSTLFFSEIPKKAPVKHHEPEEYTRLKLIIDMQKNEIKTLKSKIKKLENCE